MYLDRLPFLGYISIIQEKDSPTNKYKNKETIMKLRTLFTLILTLALGAFANITGSFAFKDTNLVITSTVHPVVQVAYQGNVYSIQEDGTFNIPTSDQTSIKTNPVSSHRVLTREYDVFGRRINLNQTQSWATQFASIKQYSTVSSPVARSLSTSVDTLYIVVNGDTLREVPITSWNQVLPPNYVVQRNVQVRVKSVNKENIVQAVWFGDRDSIAHVLDLEHNQPDHRSFSGFIYTVYNDTDFQHNAHLFNLFVRTRSNDSIKTYSSILDVKAHVGNVGFDSTDFDSVTYHTLRGYSLTPNDSSVAVFSTKNISMVFVTDTLDSLVTYDSTTFTTFQRKTDSVAYNPNGHINFQIADLNRNNVSYTSGDTSVFKSVVSVKLKGVALQDIDTLTMFNDYPPQGIRGLKANDPFTFTIHSYPIASKIDNNNVNQLEVVFVWKISKGYWKNP